jgi:hypothetical protein
MQRDVLAVLRNPPHDLFRQYTRQLLFQNAESAMLLCARANASQNKKENDQNKKKNKKILKK